MRYTYFLPLSSSEFSAPKLRWRLAVGHAGRVRPGSGSASKRGPGRP
ncbi:hypothetical protein [Moorena producens]|nr:hypothetical protein [Moorena producens]